MFKVLLRKEKYFKFFQSIFMNSVYFCFTNINVKISTYISPIYSIYPSNPSNDLSIKTVIVILGFQYVLASFIGSIDFF